MTKRTLQAGITLVGTGVSYYSSYKKYLDYTLTAVGYIALGAAISAFIAGPIGLIAGGIVGAIFGTTYVIAKEGEERLAKLNEKIQHPKTIDTSPTNKDWVATIIKAEVEHYLDVYRGAYKDGAEKFASIANEQYDLKVREYGSLYLKKQKTIEQKFDKELNEHKSALFKDISECLEKEKKRYGCSLSEGFF